jgi:hypothetical protein
VGQGAIGEETAYFGGGGLGDWRLGRAALGGDTLGGCLDMVSSPVRRVERRRKGYRRWRGRKAAGSDGKEDEDGVDGSNRGDGGGGGVAEVGWEAGDEGEDGTETDEREGHGEGDDDTDDDDDDDDDDEDEGCEHDSGGDDERWLTSVLCVTSGGGGRLTGKRRFLTQFLFDLDIPGEGKGRGDD